MPAYSHRPLHVLVLTPFFPSDRNEVNGCFVAESVAALPRVGIHCTVIATYPSHYPKVRAIPGAPARWVRYLQVPGVVGLSTAGRFLSARLKSSVEAFHRREPVDLIHAHAALPCGHAAALLSRESGIPFVVTVHGLDVFNSCGQEGWMAAQRNRVSKNVYAQAGSVICISRKVRDVLRRGMPDSALGTIIANGVDPVLFHPPNDRSQDPGAATVEILTVGSLLPSKGHELVIRAVARLKASVPGIHCHIVGEGPDRERLESISTALGVRAQITFLGRLSRSAVADAMRKCTIFALPSENEGLGCVYLEAMGCGKPVIGCRGQGVEDVIENGGNGFLVGPQDLDALSECLSELCHSAGLRDRVGIAAQKTILGKFALKNQAELLRNTYEQAISPQRKP